MDTLKCAQCGRPFELAQETASRFPGWKPKLCRDCYARAKGKPEKARPELNLTPREVIERFDAGPDTGIFTDGSCDPNPGPGGWGVVKVVGGTVVAERCGHAPATTNNRMEMTALIEAFKMLAPGERVDVYTDSALCFNIITKWAPNWRRNGWRRGKKGNEEISNIDLVKEAYELAASHPEAEVRWMKGHDGARWNEYADSLATAYTRAEA